LRVYLIQSVSLFILTFLTWSGVSAQLQGRIIDATNGVPLAFVTIVIEGSNQGTYSDIDGAFAFESALPGDLLMCSYVGYKSTNIQLEGATFNQKQFLIELTPIAVELTEAVVLPGENPAHRIVKLAMQNKKQNNPEVKCSFIYDSYNKFVVTAVLDSAVYTNPDLITELDSSDQDAVQFFEEQHLLLMESVSERKYIPPGKSTEKVKASRVSGFSDPSLVMLGTQLQSFSFYENEVNILDLQYLSPLHTSALRKYIFTIEDTSFIQNDTLFVLSFQPKKSAKINGMKGQLHINSNGYALQHVIAEPDEPVESFNVKIRQAYEFIDSSQWFPVQLNTNILFSTMSVGPLQMIGIGRTYIDNIQINPELKRKDIGEVMLKIDPLAGAHTPEYWDEYRKVELDKKELQTYHVIDSLSKAEGFDRKLRWLKSLASGKLRVKKIDLDLDKVIRVNSSEGFRLGMGFHTNELLMKRISVGGYGGYGFKDKKFKYGADAKWSLRQVSATYLKVAYQNEVFERGGLNFPKASSWLSDEGYYGFFVNQMDRVEQYEASFGTALPGYLSVKAAFRMGEMEFSEDYAFAQAESEQITLIAQSMGFNEAEMNVRWAYKEKIIESNNVRSSLGTVFPVFGVNLQVGQGEGMAEQLNWTRLSASIKYTKKMPVFGVLTAFIHAGKLYGEAPALRQFALSGTAGQWSVAAPFSFETMATGSFFQNEYAAVHLRHNFRDLLLRVKNFRPHFVLVHSMAIGKGVQETNHRNLNLNSAENGYIESGLEIKNILKSGFSAIGLGGYYRYGSANTGDLKSDLMLKIALSFVF
jgi:hypothetical protein